MAVAEADGTAPETAMESLPPVLFESDLDGPLRSVAGFLGGYDTVVLAHPELRLLEALADVDFSRSLAVLVPYMLGDEALSELKANVPQGLDCAFARPSLSTLEVISPLRGALLCVGVAAGREVHLVPSWAIEALGIAASGWYGEVLLLVTGSTYETRRPQGWALLDDDRRFTGHLHLGLDD